MEYAILRPACRVHDNYETLDLAQSQQAAAVVAQAQQTALAVRSTAKTVHLNPRPEAPQILNPALLTQGLCQSLPARRPPTGFPLHSLQLLPSFPWAPQPTGRLQSTTLPWHPTWGPTRAPGDAPQGVRGEGAGAQGGPRGGVEQLLPRSRQMAPAEADLAGAGAELLSLQQPD